MPSVIVGQMHGPTMQRAIMACFLDKIVMIMAGYALVSASQTSLAQSSTTSSSETPSATSTTQTVLDPTPFTSTRANAMGGALSTIADDLDALYYNPAMIGGLGYDSQSNKKSAWQGLYFPYAGASIN